MGDISQVSPGVSDGNFGSSSHDVASNTSNLPHQHNQSDGSSIDGVSSKTFKLFNRDRSAVRASIRASSLDLAHLNPDEAEDIIFTPGCVDDEGLNPLESLTHGRTAKEMLRLLPMIKCAIKNGITFDDMDGLKHAFLMFCATRPLYESNQVAARELLDIFVSNGVDWSDVHVGSTHRGI